MRLRTLEISDFRKFDRPVRIESLEDGINVLDAPNEHGKSTLLAAVKAVLFERHGARTKAALRMQHYRNATSPVVGMSFELSDGLHRIQKRFMHKEPYARLLLPDGTRLEGDDAEERLQSLLGFAPAGKQGATDDTRGIWGALWVEQCRAEQPILVEAGRGTLHACLESELGSLTGDNLGGALLHEVRSALSVLLDGNGKPKGRLKEMIEEETRAGVDLAALQSKGEALADDIRELGRLRKNLSVANDADEAERLAADLRDARERRDVVLLHAQALTAAEAGRDLAMNRRTEAEGEVARRTARTETITAAERLVVAAEATETQASGDLRDADLALDGLREAARAAETSALTTAEQSRTTSALLDLVGRLSRLGTQERRLARAKAARDQERDVISEMAAVPADAARLHAVRNATSVLVRARSVLDAVATGIEVELDEDAAGRVTASGSVLPVGVTVLRAVSDTVIEVAGVGRVRVRPAVRTARSWKPASSRPMRP